MSAACGGAMDTRTGLRANSTRITPRVLQLLHAGAKGKFRTCGRYTAATVEGSPDRG